MLTQEMQVGLRRQESSRLAAASSAPARWLPALLLHGSTATQAGYNSILGSVLLKYQSDP